MNHEAGDLPLRRPRRRRPVPARRFTGVGRHGSGDTAAVLAARAAAHEKGSTASAAVFSEPAPLPATHGHGDEFDLAATMPSSTIHPSAESDPHAPEADGAVTQEFFLAESVEAAVQVDHHSSGFADSLQRLGVDIHDLPAGYLPAADLFSDGEIDVQAHKARRRKRGWITSIVVVLVLVVVGGAGWLGLSRLTAPAPDYAGGGSGHVEFKIANGQGSRKIAKNLEDEGIVKSAAAFNDKVGDRERTPVFQPGTFQLKKKMSAESALTALTGKGGKVLYFTVSPNARLNDALTNIANGTGFDRDELEHLAQSPKDFGLPAEATNLEGYLHPGEYRVPVDSTPRSVLEKLVGDTKSALQKQGVTDPKEQYRVLKQASVVAGEGQPGDYAEISGIIENRMKPNDETHGYLQLDSTVSYGLGQVSIHLTKDQLQDKKNPFNTYKHKGLPPTPIGSPGNRSIEAAAHPKESKNFYWVTVNLKTGETKFSQTLKEHQKNVDQYRKWCSENKDICQ